LDFPNYSNVGDSAIWLGELTHLEAALGSRPAFVCTINNFNPDDLRKAVPNGPIFLQGGGNFGDLWPDHQAFREAILTQFPDRPIIQLPQSIHFTNPDLIARAATVIKRHGNFVLFVRDKRSFETARSSFDCPVYLAPDMAFCIDTIHRHVAPTRKLLLLLRTDKESARKEAAVPRHLPKGAVIADWLQEDPGLFRKMKRWTVIKGLLTLDKNAFHKSTRRETLFRDLALNRLNRGVTLLSSAECVITDRLHCHILCVLLGIPHFVLDNSYGKLTSFVDTWIQECAFVRVAPSLDEAIKLCTASRQSPLSD
jgi:exopolysaccharide biosynthesis predicted pyruvyltransferase EpsI